MDWQAGSQLLSDAMQLHLESCLKSLPTEKEQLHQAGTIQQLLKRKPGKKVYMQNLLTEMHFQKK